MEYEFRRRVIDAKGGWFLDNPDAPPKYLAEITYRWEGEHMVVVHTGVRDSLKGTGVARMLVDVVIAAARAEGFLLIPECPYARAVFRRNPKLHDVLAPGALDRFDD